MSTILFVTVDAGGNTPPAVAIGRQLLAAGHRVRFLGHERQRQALVGNGFEFTALDPMPWWRPAERASAPRVVARLVRLSTDAGIARAVHKAVGDDPADLLVLDCMMLSAIKAAGETGLPHAVLFHTFYRFWTKNWVNGPIGLIARMRGLNARRLWSGSSLELIVADRTLDPSTERATERRVWTGPAELGQPRREDLSAPPRVLVSLSSTWLPGQLGAYRRILAALESLPVRAIVTTGNVIDPAQLHAGANVEVVSYASHAEILPTVRAVVGHGGHSTTMAALAHDVPLIVLPMHPMIDQPMIASRVAGSGAGVVLAKKASPDQIARALLDVLGSAAYAETVARVGARLRDADGARRAAQHLLSLLEAPNAPIASDLLG